MSNTSLDQAKRLAAEGKYDEALQVVESFARQLDIVARDWFECHRFKGVLLIHLGRFEDALQVANKVLQEIQPTGNLLQIVDALILKARVLLLLGREDEVLDVVSQGEDVLRTQVQSSTIQHQQAAIKLREARLSNQRGIVYWRKGNLEQALHHFQRSLALNEAIGDKVQMAFILNNIGLIHEGHGDLDRALDFFSQSLSLFGKEKVVRIWVASALLNIGRVYRLKGDLNEALQKIHEGLKLSEKVSSKEVMRYSHELLGETYKQKGELHRARQYLEKSLTLSEEMGDPLDVSGVLFTLISVTVEQQELTWARQYLERLKTISSQEDNAVINQMTRLAEALLLKASPRIRSLGKAEELLAQIVDEKIVAHELTVIALLNLCELLLLELKTFGAPEVLAELESLVNRLLDISEVQRSWWLQAEAYLFRSQLALLRLDLEEARSQMRLAQVIADKMGLHRLARVISLEHDQLLDRLDQWHSLIEQQASMQDRVELAQLEQLVVRMVRKRVEEIPEVVEEPVLLIILDKSGISLYSKPFQTKGLPDEHLLGGFLKAIESFSKDAFSVSGSLERIKHHDYMLLVKTLAPLTFCYVFKGQSYGAQQKLDAFIDSLQASEKEWQALVAFSGSGAIPRKAGIDALATGIFPSLATDSKPP